jgi:MerR family transcriptional regulator, copper efflux regulator
VADEEMYQIGSVAAAVGLSLRTIRHYEEVGVVVPSGRSAGGFRLYTDRDIDRLRLVKKMKPLDLTLDEMRDILGLLDAVDGDARDEARGTVAARLEMYAALAAERYERRREQLAAAAELTGILARSARRAAEFGSGAEERPPAHLGDEADAGK